MSSQRVNQMCVSGSHSIPIFRYTGLMAVVLLSLLAAGCVADQNNGETTVSDRGSAPGTVFRTTEQEGSSQCPGGGLLFEIGLDHNENGVLDDDEVKQWHEVCHAHAENDGSIIGSLVELSPIAPGNDSSCLHGGTSIKIFNNGVTENHDFCKPADDQCHWNNNGDGTLTVTCGAEQTYMVLEPSALAFTESIACVINIDNPRSIVDDVEEDQELFPMVYSINKMGSVYKYVTLTISDGSNQYSNSRLVHANQNQDYEVAYVRILYDIIGPKNGGYFSALISEKDNLAEFSYYDRDLAEFQDGTRITLTVPAFNYVDSDGENRAGACNRTVMNP